MKLIRILLEQLKSFSQNSILCLYNCSQYLNWLKAQIQRNYFKPKRPKTNWSLAQIWAVFTNCSRVYFTVYTLYEYNETSNYGLTDPII